MAGSLFCAVSGDIALLTEKIWTFLAMQNSLLLLAESTQTPVIVLGLVDPEGNHQFLLLPFFRHDRG